MPPSSLPPPTPPRARAEAGRARYVLPDEVRDAVRVADAIGRPLLLRGNPGSGKSTLARWVAEQWGWTYLEDVVTSRTAARDLLWRADAVRRLGDAQRQEKDLRAERYVEPGVLWRAFDRVSAAEQAEIAGIALPKDEGEGCVVLLDEIDKAEPDVPNDLLVPLGEGWFDVAELRPSPRVTRKRPVLVVLTDNGERDLPPAFLRRCVTVWLKDPKEAQLVAIAEEHRLRIERKDLEDYAKRFEALKKKSPTRPLSTAEFLDALRAVEELGPGAWDTISQVAVLKAQAPS